MIKMYVRDVRRALEHECWFAALSLALALPDICGMAEFPDKTVGERYIGWYDRYVAKHLDLETTDEHVPCISGEVVYNLRNTFLHRGETTVIPEKVKEARNRVDRFVLILGDGSMIQSMALAVALRDVAVRTLVVDVTYLCHAICDCAIWYYQKHREAFAFDFNIIPQAALFGEDIPQDKTVVRDDPLGALLQAKLKDAGRDVRMSGNLTSFVVNSISRSRLTETAVYSRLEEAPSETVQSETHAMTPVKPRETASMASQQETNISKSPKPKAEGDDRREHRLRCFFGEHFKEKKYVTKKEDIIKAYLSAHTKTQLNTNLTRLFPGEDVKVILARLKPLTADWPGQ